MNRFAADPQEDLRQAVAAGRVILIVGAGVTLASTDRPEGSWAGLLTSAIAQCRAIDAIGSDQAEDWLRQLTGAQAEALLQVAGRVTDLLESRGEYSRWLRRAFYDLKAERRDLLQAVLDLRSVIVTTNYDNLLEEVSGRRPLTWLQSEELQAALRGDDDAIIHLHGYYTSAKSVVLNVDSYERLLGNGIGATLREIATTHTLVFVGVGDGMSDPNFGTLRAWLARHLAGSPYRHYRLVPNESVQRARMEHAAGERIMVVGHGQGHGSLVAYLRSLRPHRSRGPVAPMTGLSPGQGRNHGHPVEQVAITADGRFVASLGGGRLRLWTTPTLREIRLPSPSVERIRGPLLFCLNASALAVGVPGGVLLWPIDGREPVTLGLGTGETPSDWSAVWSLAASDDGRWLAAGSGLAHGGRRTVAVWQFDDTERSRSEARLLDVPYVASMAFQPGTTMLALGSTDASFGVQFWDPQRGVSEQELSTDGYASRVAFDARGLNLLAVIKDRDQGRAKAQVWDVRDVGVRAPILIDSKDHYGNNATAVISPGGDEFVTLAENRDLVVRSLHGNERRLLTQEHEVPVETAFTGDGAAILVLSTLQEGSLGAWQLLPQGVNPLGRLDAMSFAVPQHGGAFAVGERSGFVRLVQADG